MKKHRFVATLVAATAALCQSGDGAVRVSVDHFDYPATSQLVGQTNPDGLTWVPAGSGAEQPVIQPVNLAVPGLQGSVGNRVQVTAGVGTGARLPFGGAETNGTIFCSFALKVADLSGLGAGTDFFFAFTPSDLAQATMPTNGFARILLRSAVGGYQIGLSKSSAAAGDIAWHPTAFTSNDTVFVVGGYTFTAGPGNDTARLWLNPSASEFGAANAPAASLTATTGLDANQLASLVLLQKPAPVAPANLYLDELRLAGTWAEVTPAASAGPVDLNVVFEGLHPEAEVAGQSFRYTVTISNAGPAAAMNGNVTVAHTGLAVSELSAASTAGSCVVTGNEVRCALNALPAEQTATIEVTLTPQVSGKLTIAASAASASPELRPADNIADFQLPVLFQVQDCACSCSSNTPAGDVLLTSWFTKYSGQYARTIPQTGAAARPRWEAGPPTTATTADDIVANLYADVQKIQFDADFIYVTAYGLASYEMGPWYCDIATLFPNWPAAQTRPFKIPRNLDASTCTDTGLDAIGLWVNGTAVYNMLDGFYYDPKSDPWPGTSLDSADVKTGALGGVWHRDAWFSEKDTFDPAKFHSTGSGQYHSHANPMALRYQLGDHVDYDAATKVYYESYAPVTEHSPILGWAFDGHPIYGPYGYSDPWNAASGIRRMRSGYVPRNGANNTIDLNSSGRTTLPTWARLVQGRATSALDPTKDEYGPRTGRPIDTTRCNPIPFDLGRYAEDNAYLGHLINPADGDWFRQGEDFDLDLHNGRCCVTPEFPNGTYAYFVTIDDNGLPVFPYILGWQYCGKPTGGENAMIPTNGVTTCYSAQQATLASPLRTGGLVKLQWNSREGGQYRVLSSEDLRSWTPVSQSLPSAGTVSSYTLDPGQPAPPHQFYKVELERDGASPVPANP